METAPPSDVVSVAQFWSLDVVGAFQIAFWLVAGILAILTYSHARTGVLQPLRTEVFKLQLALLARVYQTYALKSEVELRDLFDLRESLRYNVVEMAEQYASRELNSKPVDGKTFLERHREVLVVGRVELAYFEKVELVSAPSDSKTTQERNQRTPKPWSEYKHSMVHLTVKYREATAEASALLRDPLLPSPVRSALEDLLDQVERNVSAIARTVEAAATKMAASYPDLESLARGDLSWASNIWNRESGDLEPKARAVAEAIRGHVGVDTLTLHTRKRDAKYRS